jgi:hypothetical protein
MGMGMTTPVAVEIPVEGTLLGILLAVVEIPLAVVVVVEIRAVEGQGWGRVCLCPDQMCPVDPEGLGEGCRCRCTSDHRQGGWEQ